MTQKTKYDTGKQGEIDSVEYLLKAGFSKPSKEERSALASAFHDAGFMIYANGFDAIQTRSLNKFNVDGVVDGIVLYELKTAGKNRKSEVKPDFSGLGFTLTDAERKNATLLGNQYKFIFLNLKTQKHAVCMIDDFFHDDSSRIYKTWSVFFHKGLSTDSLK